MKKLFLLSLLFISSIGCDNIHHKKTKLDLDNVIRIDDNDTYITTNYIKFLLTSELRVINE